MSTFEEIVHESLWKDLNNEDTFPNKTPLLAHYTSISNFDLIIGNGEIWFSNPLNMNDSDELLFGMNQGASEFRQSEELKVPAAMKVHSVGWYKYLTIT